MADEEGLELPVNEAGDLARGVFAAEHSRHRGFEVLRGVFVVHGRLVSAEKFREVCFELFRWRLYIYKGDG